MTSMPASRSARAITFTPRSWPSSPGFAITTRILVSIRAQAYVEPSGYHPGDACPRPARRPRRPRTGRLWWTWRLDHLHEPRCELHLRVSARLHRRLQAASREIKDRPPKFSTAVGIGRVEPARHVRVQHQAPVRVVRAGRVHAVRRCHRSAIARASDLKITDSSREKMGPLDAYSYELQGPDGSGSQMTLGFKGKVQYFLRCNWVRRRGRRPHPARLRPGSRVLQDRLLAGLPGHTKPGLSRVLRGRSMGGEEVSLSLCMLSPFVVTDLSQAPNDLAPI